MPIDDFAAWKNELLFTGRIVQDEGDSVDPNAAHRRSLRYCELVEQLDGAEGPEALAALIPCGGNVGTGCYSRLR